MALGGKPKLRAEEVRLVPSGCGARSRRKRRKRRDEPGLPAPGGSLAAVWVLGF